MSSIQEDLAIDLHKLEDEWQKQPLLYEFYAQNAALALKARDYAKNSLEQLTAETALRIRKDPESFGLEKVTEGAIQETLDNYDSIIKAKNHLATMNYDLQVARNNVNAIDTKKKALEQEVELYKGQYFSTPREEGDVEGGKRFLNEMKEKSRAEHREVMEKNKKNRRDAKTEKQKYDETPDSVKEKIKAATGKTEEEITGESKPRRRRRR